MDLVIEDDSRGRARLLPDVARTTSRRQIALPWVSFGSDAGSPRARGRLPELEPASRAPTATSRACSASTSATRSVIPLEEAVRRLTALPADNLGLRDRGALAAGLLRRRRGLRSRDDRRTTPPSTEPHQYATGVRDVFVNGVQVLADGEHTGATPGRVVRGPGLDRLAGRRRGPLSRRRGRLGSRPRLPRSPSNGSTDPSSPSRRDGETRLPWNPELGKPGSTSPAR